MKRQTTLKKETNDWSTRTSPWAKTIIILETRHHAMQKDQNTVSEIMLRTTHFVMLGWCVPKFYVAIKTSSIVTYYLCRRWPRICPVCRSHKLVLFLINHRIFYKSTAPLIVQELFTFPDYPSSFWFLVGFVLLNLLLSVWCFVEHCVVCSSISTIYITPCVGFKHFFSSRWNLL